MSPKGPGPAGARREGCLPEAHAVTLGTGRLAAGRRAHASPHRKGIREDGPSHTHTLAKVAAGIVANSKPNACLQPSNLKSQVLNGLRRILRSNKVC